MVRVEDPDPLIDGGVKPPLLTPPGNPDSLVTARLTVPVKPLTGVTVTVNIVESPGWTCCAGGLTVIEKSGVAGVTVIVRVGGLGSELPVESMTVSEVSYVPGAEKLTLPGFWTTEVAGDPPGKTQE